MAIYSREYCEDFVQRLLKLTDADVVRFWIYACGMVAEEVKTMVQLDAFVVEWNNMPIWNRQGVCFLLVEHIEYIARDRAKTWAAAARVVDPL